MRRSSILAAGAALSIALAVGAEPSAAASYMSCTSTSSGPNLLQNGDFSSHSTVGWCFSGNDNLTFVVGNGFAGYKTPDGQNFVYEGPVGSDGVLSQAFSDTAGGMLTITGWVAGNGSNPSSFKVAVDGRDVLTSYEGGVPKQGFSEFSVTAPASGFDVLSVGFHNDPSFDAFTDFSVTENTSSVPEPASWAMMILGMGIAGLGLRRRGRTVVA